METQKVSIVTACYNSADFIGQAIESCLAQSYRDWEMIVVDDASSDSSRDIVASYAQRDPRVKLIALDQNQGPAVARNRAIQAAQGRYIAFLDSDDLWRPEKLSRQLDFMREGGLAFTHSFYDVIDESGAATDRFVRSPKTLNYRQLMRSNRIGCLTAIYDAEKLGKVEMPLIRKRQDYGLWLKILKQGVVAHCLPEALASYRDRSGSISDSKIDLVKYNWELFRQVEQLSFLNSLYYLGCNITYKLLR